MPLLYERDPARGDDPFKVPPCEGIDFKSCWTCCHLERIPTSDYPVKKDIGYCHLEKEVIADVHEPNDCCDWTFN